MSSSNQPKDPNATVWADTAFRAIVEDFVTDPRFVGYTRYITTLEMRWSRSIETACAGHGFIFFNPDFFESIPEETRKTVFAHEVRHLVLRHLERGEGYDQASHNVAADHVINLGLEADGFTFEGTNPLKDPKFKGMSTEQVYNEVYTKADPGSRPVMGPGDPTVEQIEDMVEEALQGSGKTLDQQKDENGKAVEAAQAAAGKEPGMKSIRLDVNPNIVTILNEPYEKIFAKYLVDPIGSTTRTYQRPSRRAFAMKNNNLRLPGRKPRPRKSNRLTHLVYALDVSGSITPHQATQFHNSVRAIKDKLNPMYLTVLFFDTKIVLEKTFSSNEPYGDIQVRAGGGTDLSHVYNRAKQLNPEALVVFTDLEVSIPKQQDWDSIWIVPDGRIRIPPNMYGEVYRIPPMQGPQKPKSKKGSKP